MFKLDWTTINSNVYRLIDPFHLFRVGKLIADWHEVATANQKINCNALLCKFPATNMGLGLESIYIYICTSLQISWAKEGRFNSNVDQEKDTSMECIHQGKKSALELAIYIYMCIYIVNHTHLQRHVTKQSLSRNNHIKCFHKISLEHKSASSALILLTSNLGSRFGSGSWPLSFVFGLGSHLLAFGSKTQDRLRDRYRSWMNIRSVLETWGYGYMNFDPNVENNRGHELILEGSVEGVTFVKCDMFVCGIVCEIKRCEKYAVRYKIESSQRWGSGEERKTWTKWTCAQKGNVFTNKQVKEHSKSKASSQRQFQHICDCYIVQLWCANPKNGGCPCQTDPSFHHFSGHRVLTASYTRSNSP